MFCNPSRFASGLLLLCLLSTSACGRLLIAIGLMSDSVHVKRLAPAEQDLAETATVAIATLSGDRDDTLTMNAELGQLLGASGRFALVESERLDALGRANGCTGATDLGCIARSLPASAVLLGSITPLNYQENMQRDSHECVKNGRKTLCYMFRRVGTANGSANLRLVDTSTRRVLCQKLITKRAQVETNYAYDGDEPDPIDSLTMLEAVRRDIAYEFFAAISPHAQFEKVSLVSDSDLPEIGKGNDLLKRGAVAQATQLYKSAVEKSSAGGFEAETSARARYALAVGFVANEQYDEALSSLREALALNPDDDWKEVRARFVSWKADAESAARQLAFAKPADTSAIAQNRP